MGKWIVPSKFTPEDILFMYEELREMIARINGFEGGVVDLDELLIAANEANDILDEIEIRVGVQAKYLL